MAKTPAELIEAKGDSAAFAAAVGWKPGAVRLWKHRNRIPRQAWPEITKAFPDVSLDDLLRIEGEAA